MPLIPRAGKDALSGFGECSEALLALTVADARLRQWYGDEAQQ